MQGFLYLVRWGVKFKLAENLLIPHPQWEKSPPVDSHHHILILPPKGHSSTKTFARSPPSMGKIPSSRLPPPNFDSPTKGSCQAIKTLFLAVVIATVQFLFNFIYTLFIQVMLILILVHI